MRWANDALKTFCLGFKTAKISKNLKLIHQIWTNRDETWQAGCPHDRPQACPVWDEFGLNCIFLLKKHDNFGHPRLGHFDPYLWQKQGSLRKTNLIAWKYTKNGVPIWVVLVDNWNFEPFKSNLDLWKNSILNKDWQIFMKFLVVFWNALCFLCNKIDINGFDATRLLLHKKERGVSKIKN